MWLSRILLLFILAFKFVSCNDNGVTGVTLMPEIKETDSVEVIFFKEPGNQRFYTYLPTRDKNFIENLVKDLDREPEMEKDENTCVKEGKIYMHKQGNIFNTVFFSYDYNSCLFLRFIKNGKLYYFPISESLREKLKQYKPLAKEPVASDKAPDP